MASCQFPAGIAQVSGTLSKSTIVTSKGIITRRVVACIRNGKQRIYWREDKPRCTKLSDKEKAARESFSLIASEVSRRIEAGDKRPRKLIWAEVKNELKKGGNDAEV